MKLLPLLLILAGLGVYANSFNGTFFFDDHPSIRDNPYIRRLWPVWEAMSWPNPSAIHGRPVAALSLAISYALGGLKPWAYHAVNVTIHLLAGLVLFGIVRRTLVGTRLRDRFGADAPGLAAAIALLWLVHPLLTETVDYVIQRTEGLMGLFFFLTLYCVIRGAASSRRFGWYAAAVISCALGMGSKEVMVGAPLAVLLYDRAFLSGSFLGAVRARASLYAGLAATWVILGALLTSGSHGESAGFTLSVTPWEYARTQPGVILHYLRLCFWPNPLVVDYYDWPIARTAAAILPAGVVVIGLLAATVWALYRQPALGFLGAWFFLALGPTSSVLPLVGEFAAERRMYMPLAAVVTVAVIAAHAGLRRLFPARSSDLLRRAAGVGLLLAVAIPLGHLTVRRHEDYRSEVGIWADIVAKRPNNARAQNNLGGSLEAQGRLKEATEHYAEAVRANPRFVWAHNNLGRALVKQGRFDEAVPHLNQALRLNPTFVDAQGNLGQALVKRGEVDKGIALLFEAVRRRPDHAPTRLNLGDALASQGRMAEAITQYAEVARLRPNSVEAQTRLAAALHRQGRLDEAASHYAEAVRLGPRDAWTHYNLGVARLQQGKLEDAARHFEDALRLDPNHPRAARALEEVQKQSTGPDRRVPRVVGQASR